MKQFSEISRKCSGDDIEGENFYYGVISQISGLIREPFRNIEKVPFIDFKGFIFCSNPLCRRVRN